MEVAYGTDRGGVRVIVRHPENIGHTPQLFQSYNVHSNPVSKVVLGEKHLVSGEEERGREREGEREKRRNNLKLTK